MPQREKSTCTRMLQSTCDNIQPENLDCCFRQQTVHHIFTTSWKIAGSRHGSSTWDWTRRGWAGTHSSVFVRPGFVVPVAWKISTTSGWLISRRRCRKSTHTSMRNLKCASQRPSEWAMALPFRRLLRSEEHTSELQSHSDLVCRLLLEKKKA